VSYFAGLQLEDPALFGGAIRDAGRAVESLMAEVVTPRQGGGRAPTLQRVILDLETKVKALRNQEDAKKLRQTADLLREIRNQATHQGTSLDFGKISARLSLDLLFAVLDFCEVVFTTDIGQDSQARFDLGVV